MLPVSLATFRRLFVYMSILMYFRADTAKRLLGKTANWHEKKVLGSAKFSDDSKYRGSPHSGV